MNVVTEVLYRAAVVKTLTQIAGIEGVSFQVAGTPLSDQKGNAVGVMTDDSFVENTGETINAYSRDTLTLYFASEDGTHLRQERVNVVYNSNMSMEKLIMEQLIAGPQAEGYRAVLPAGCDGAEHQRNGWHLLREFRRKTAEHRGRHHRGCGTVCHCGFPDRTDFHSAGADRRQRGDPDGAAGKQKTGSVLCAESGSGRRVRRKNRIGRENNTRWRCRRPLWGCSIFLAGRLLSFPAVAGSKGARARLGGTPDPIYRQTDCRGRNLLPGNRIGTYHSLCEKCASCRCTRRGRNQNGC